MAYLSNPYYGSVPGAPAALNWWEGPQFRMSGLPPVPAPAAAPAPLAATVTPQDIAAQSAFVPPRTDTGGAQPGGGGPGTGPGGIGGASGGGQDRTTSGYPGVYAESPVDINSQFGTGLGLAGAAVPFPGAGTVLGAAGGAIDAARYNGILGQYGIQGTVNPWGSAGAAALASIGIPFTNWDLAHLLGVPTARERMAEIIAGAPPGLYNDQGYGAIAANEPRSPGAPFGNTGWAAGMNPTSSQYPPGFGLNEVALAAPGIIAANPDIFGAAPAKGAFDAGAWGTALAGKPGDYTGPAVSTGTAAGKEGVDPATGQATGGKGGSDVTSTGSASDKGDTTRGSSADTSREGGSDAYKYRGGLIGPPPGRYAAGGTVGRAAGRMPQYQSLPYEEMVPRDYVSDEALRQPHYLPGAGQPDESGRLSPREQAIQDFMGEMFRAREREMYPEMLARGGTVGGPAPQPGDNISPAAFGLLRAINPPGPDDQIGALQTGEGVITAGAMKRYPGLLAAANAGTLDPGRVKGLLAPAARPRRLR